MKHPKIKRQFGLWLSPITPKTVAESLELEDVAWGEDGSLIWLEKRSGRGALGLLPPDRQAWREFSGEHSVRASLGYGGGDFSCGNRFVYFVEAASGRIFRQPVEVGVAQTVTPAFGASAAPQISPDGRWLLFVHSYEGQDCIGIVEAEGRSWPQKLVSGGDFYMQPVWHPRGDKVAWITWDHPNMPWDGTWLYLGRLAANSGTHCCPNLESSEIIAGGEEISIFQPEFSPDGHFLAYVSDERGWWQIYLYDIESESHRLITDTAAEHAVPAWQQGRRTYGFSPDSQSLFFLRNQNGFGSLWQIDLQSGEERQLPVGDEYSWFEQIAVSPDGGEIAIIASGSTTPKRLLVYSLREGTRIIRRMKPENISQENYAAPEPITWPGLDGQDVHGLYFAPQNEHYEGLGLPPLIIIVHGGPTSQRTTEYDDRVQFFTSRGYAILQVNYRGSTGYGRAYRQQLRGKWGVYDVEDCVSGARHLVSQGKVDQDRLVIMGSSAGGFTVLKALEDYPGFFKAGINLYGISNQFMLATDTHKFEAHYSESLLGPLPEAAAIYRERSPIYHVDHIQDPLAIFQGEDDRVVLRQQSDELVAKLSARGIPHLYHVYAGEGHGFHKSETIEHYYATIDKFLRDYVLFA